MSLLKRILMICFYVLVIVSCKQKSKEQIELEEYKLKIKTTIEKMESDNLKKGVNNQSVYLGVDSIHKIGLRQYVNRPKLFLYFSSNTCSSCIDETVEITERVFPNYKKNEGIVFISPDYPARFRINCYGKKLLNLEKGKLGLPLENSTEPPFFIVIDSTMQVKSIHVVNKMNFDRTEIYLNGLAKSFDFK